MRLDHIAYRVEDRYKTSKFLKDCLGYNIGTEFQIEFDDSSKAECLAMVPPENRHPDTHLWSYFSSVDSSPKSSSSCLLDCFSFHKLQCNPINHRGQF